MPKSIKIKNTIIGEEYLTFLIAEMACAHQGDVEIALDLIDVAVKANVNAVQLQMFKKEAYMNPMYSGWDLCVDLELSFEEWLKVIAKIRQSDLLFFAAAYDIEMVRFCVDNNVDAFKIHSADLSNIEVLKAIAKTGKPIFLSTGASKFKKIEEALNVLRKNGVEDIVLMHGYQAFPTKIEETHLNFIRTLENKFDLNVGFYDHVDGGSILAKIVPIMAIGYGAQVIEKHFIMSREDKGIDYESSLDPPNFIEFVKILREAEKAIGSKEIREFTEDEINYRKICKKSIVAKVDISKGQKITKDKVMFVRSNPGIPPIEFEKIKGKIAKNDIKKYHNLTNNDF